MAFSLALSACGQKVSTWQEQYDLGVRYLEEGNYEEAIIAFTTAIEIDPKRVEAYSGLANIYLVMGETEKAAEVWRNVPQELDADDLSVFTSQAERYEGIQEFWESGEAGIRITSLSFDKEAYLAGKETVFIVTVLYRCPKDINYGTSMKANLNDANTWDFISDDSELTGSGVMVLKGSAVPVGWKNRYFGIAVDLWEGIEPWEWINSDTWYITPDGEITDHYAPTNEYGGTEFTARYQYQDFSAMNAADQKRICDIVEATIEGDYDVLLSLCDDDGLDRQILTIWNGYKIKINDQTTWNINNEQDAATDHNRHFDIEMRPQSGVGYVCSVYDAYTENTGGKDSWLDFYKTVQVISCPCDNWQWNGSFTDQQWIHYLWKSPNDEDERRWYHTDYTTAEHYENIITTGTMNMNLKDGTATMTTHSVENWSTGRDDLDEDATWTDTFLYQNGILIEKNGEPWDGGKGYQLIDGSGGGVTYSNEQLRLDAMYW